MNKFIVAVVLLSSFAVAACAAPAQNVSPTPNPPPTVPSPLPARLNSPSAPNTPASSVSPTANGPLPNVDAQLNQPFVLHVGQTAILTDTPDQFGITFYNVPEDSRCPRGVVCVWAGQVVVQFTFQENGLLHPPVIELTTNPQDEKNARVIEGYRIALVEVQPPAIAGQTIPPNEYQATFLVTRAEPTPTPVSNTTTGALDQPLTVKFFQPVDFPQADMRLTLNSILEDSRCPKQVNCVQAGRALLGITLEHKDDIAFFRLSTMPPDGMTRVYFQGYVVELLNVAPSRETPDQKLEPKEYLVTLVVRAQDPPATVHKNEGFTLRVGESAAITEENARVKLVAVSNDSRCPWMASCAVRGNAVVEAVLTLADGTEQKFILNEDHSKPTERIPDTGNYSLELLALAPYPRVTTPPQVQEIPQTKYEATFVLREFASIQPLPTKTPGVLQPTSCLNLTPQDAESILGTPVIPQPLDNVLISPQFDDLSSPIESQGLCGFISAEMNLDASPAIAQPRVILPTLAAYAITAARVEGARVLELARIANVVRGATPDADSTPYLILKTRLAAGDWDGIFQSFQELTDSADVHFEDVDSFGDAGLWIWRQGAQRNYAALLVRDGSAFVVMEALVQKNISETAAKESMHSAMGKAFR